MISYIFIDVLQTAYTSFSLYRLSIFPKNKWLLMAATYVKRSQTIPFLLRIPIFSITK
jgi:hypothetical protein